MNYLAAIFKLALPVAILSFVMVSWALKKGHVQERLTVKALEKEMKVKAKSKDKTKDKPKHDLFHRQWAKFGGGFYGIVALYTYGLVEWQELRDFIASFGGFVLFIEQLSFQTIIHIFIEGLKNFITAISWPVYWIRELGSNHIWIWGAMAYGAYWLGAKAAQRYSHLIDFSGTGKSEK
ncbi:MAG: hypothetical protein ACI9H8_001428 [Lysobacterales bacterium]|jgi:hypothetical protein